MNKPKTNLWLDDVRPCPFVGGWRVALDYSEAIEILENYTVVNCSLDHDLAWEHYDSNVNPRQYTEKTGLDVVRWMEANDCWPVNPPTVHSLNPVGARRMAEILAHHYGCNVVSLIRPYRKGQ
jgi:hypothetical protein